MWLTGEDKSVDLSESNMKWLSSILRVLSRAISAHALHKSPTNATSLPAKG